jgi:hypothetical protein
MTSRNQFFNSIQVLATLSQYLTVKMLTAIFRAGLLERAPLLPYAAHLLHSGPEEAAERLDRLSRLHIACRKPKTSLHGF